MKSMFRVLSVLAVFAAGCSSDVAPGANDPSVAQFAATCQMTVRLADSDGSIAQSPIIEPEHVAKIEPATPIAAGDRSVQVTLTPLGERRMQTHTRDKVGHSAVVYCGDKEIFRARIMEPLAGTFQVSLPEPTDP